MMDNVEGWGFFFCQQLFFGSLIEGAKQPVLDQKQDIFSSLIVLHKVSAAKSYGFGALLLPCTIVTKNALLHPVIRNVGQQRCEVSKRERLRGRTMR